MEGIRKIIYWEKKADDTLLPSNAFFFKFNNNLIELTAGMFVGARKYFLIFKMAKVSSTLSNQVIIFFFFFTLMKTRCSIE